MLKKKLALAAVAVMMIAGSPALFAAGTTDWAKEELTTAEYTPPDFEVFYIQANADVKIHLADTQRVVITAPEGFHDRIRLRSKKGELTISVKGKEEKAPRFSVDVYTPPLSAVGASFTATLAFSGEVVQREFTVGQAGSAEVTASLLNCESVNVGMAGEGAVFLTGNARVVDISLVGNGTVDAQNLETGETTANIVGSGKIITWTTGNLAVNGVGNGEIQYRGTPVMDFNAVGSSRIVRLPDNL